MNFKNFCEKNNQSLQDNNDAGRVFDFLAEPATVHNMTCFSDIGLPAISGIIPRLEEDFGNCPSFPLSDFRNRQIVGRMVKYILGFYGYVPQVGGLDERANIRAFSNSQYFKTASVYSRTKDEPQRTIVVTSR